MSFNLKLLMIKSSDFGNADTSFIVDFFVEKKRWFLSSHVPPPFIIFGVTISINRKCFNELRSTLLKSNKTSLC